MGRRPVSLLLLIASAVYAWPRSARADHTLPPVPRRVLPFTGKTLGYLRMDASATGYAINSDTGTVWTTGIDGQVRVSKRIGARFRLPVHRLMPDNGMTQTGLGDLVVGGYGLLRFSPVLTASLGCDVLLPTGDRAKGLGHDAVALAPLVQLTYTANEHHNVYVRTSAVANVTEGDAAATAPLVTRADSEVRAALGTTYLRHDWRAAAELRLQAPLGDDPNAGEIYYTAAPSIDVRLSPHMWSSLFGELPVLPTRRIDWRAGVAVSYAFE